MDIKLLIILIVIIIFTTLSLLFKLFGYSLKAKKYGIKTTANVIGYYMYYDLETITWYPVVRFNKMNGEEVVARSRTAFSLPVYKIGETITIKYYASDISNIEYKDIYINRISTKKEKIYIDSNIKFNIIDFKHLLDVILEILILVVWLFVIMYK